MGEATMNVGCRRLSKSRSAMSNGYDFHDLRTDQVGGDADCADTGPPA